MNGLSVIFVAVAIAINGIFALDHTIDNEGNVSNQLNFHTDESLPGKASLVDNVNFDEKNVEPIVPAREFTIGRLTTNSLAVSS